MFRTTVMTGSKGRVYYTDSPSDALALAKEGRRGADVTEVRVERIRVQDMRQGRCTGDVDAVRLELADDPCSIYGDCYHCPYRDGCHARAEEWEKR